MPANVRTTNRGTCGCEGAACVDDTEITACALAAGRGDRDAAAVFVRATHRDVTRCLAHLAGASTAG